MSDNPLIANLKLPGRTFQLPSRGLFYTNGELSSSVRDGEIHVSPMSAMDEINIKNPDQLFSGTAINTIFKQCITGIEKPTELLSKDVDAIMLFLRTVTYGPSYEFSAKHTCKDAKNHRYICDIDTVINRMTIIDPTMIENMYTIKLQNGQTVKLKPNRYQQVLDLIKANESKKEINAQDQRENLLMMLLGVIDSVDEISDKKLLIEWINKIPSPLVNRIAEKIETINSWGADLTWTTKCRDCGEELKIDIPINPVLFFTE